MISGVIEILLTSPGPLPRSRSYRLALLPSRVKRRSCALQVLTEPSYSLDPCPAFSLPRSCWDYARCPCHRCARAAALPCRPDVNSDSYITTQTLPTCPPTLRCRKAAFES